MKKYSNRKFVLTVLCGISFILGLFFLSPNFTGNAVGSFEKGSSTIIGIVFIVLGILGYYFIAKMADYL